MKPLFFIGNRRSGTNMTTYLLNTHPHIFMALEADTLWYINQNKAHHSHPDDHPSFLHLEEDGPLIRLDRAPDHDHVIGRGMPRQQFENDLLWYARNGMEGFQDAYPEKDDIRWIGDKKPNITTDPSMRRWFDTYFPDAHLIHLVREPRRAVASMLGLGWAGGDADFLVDYYCRLERQANDMAQAYPCLFLRYEDVCEDEQMAMERVCEFLGLNVSLRDQNLKRGEVMKDGYAQAVRRADPDEVPITDCLSELSERYGY